MSKKQFYLISIGIILVVVIAGFRAKSNATLPAQNVTFETQLSTFQQLGFEFNKGASKEDLIEMWGKDQFAEEPYYLMYISLGSTIEREPWTPITNQCWRFDTEAIEGSGSYIDIMENLRRISNGEINITNIEDVVDWENEKASVSFEWNGNKYSWDLAFDDDWVDPLLFSQVVELTEKYNTKGRLTYFDTGGQDLVLGWADASQLKELNAKTGLEIDWLY